jgi:two-component system OmpR family sensor kinase
MSWTPERRNEVALAAFCVACAVAMLALPQWQTVPFHWIWITLTFLYGFRRWTAGQTASVLGAVIAVTTIAMLRPGGLGDTENGAELSEIPLMACVFLGMVWHVRRRQDAVDEQRRAAEREREFMRDAAHTLRTPLTVAQGHAELLLDGLVPGSARHHDATVLLDELRRLSRISNGLLMLGTAAATEAQLVAPVRLDELALEAGRRWRAAAGCEVVVRAERPVQVWGDAGRLRDALDALVENAVLATRAGDRVTISVAEHDGRAVLAVEDTGEGIGAEELPHVFERFVRGASSEGRSGTGLGLSIVKAIAEGHGGRVDVRSQRGRGTTVTVRLEARPLPAAPPIAPDALPDEPQPLRPVVA